MTAIPAAHYAATRGSSYRPPDYRRKTTLRQEIASAASGLLMGTIGALLSFISFAFFVIAIPAAWLTHIFICLASGNWGFLVAGALCFPIGIIHGMGHWVGAW